MEFAVDVWMELVGGFSDVKFAAPRETRRA